MLPNCDLLVGERGNRYNLAGTKINKMNLVFFRFLSIETIFANIVAKNVSDFYEKDVFLSEIHQGK